MVQVRPQPAEHDIDSRKNELHLAPNQSRLLHWKETVEFVVSGTHTTVVIERIALHDDHRPAISVHQLSPGEITTLWLAEFYAPQPRQKVFGVFAESIASPIHSLGHFIWSMPGNVLA